MKNKAIYLGLFGLFALPLTAVWMFSNGEDPKNNGAHSRTEQNKNSPPLKSSSKHIKVSGVGNIKYDRVEEGVDLREFCGEFIPDKPFLKHVKVKVNVYLEGDRIVHISKNKGKYKSEDFTYRALKTAQNGEPETGWGSRGCETLTHKESWLSINDKEKLAGIWMEIQSGWSSDKKEGSITPVYIRHNQDYGGDAVNIGKEFPALLVRTSKGNPSRDYSPGHPIYPREETYLRRWDLVVLMKGKNGSWYRNPDLGASVSFPEASLEAIEKWKPVFEERRRKKEEAKKRLQKKNVGGFSGIQSEIPSPF